MWPVLVVIDHPPICCLPHLGKVAEKIKVEHFFTIRPVGTFDICILIRLSGLDILDEYPGRFSPGHKFSSEKLRPIIDPQHIGQSPLVAQSFKDTDQTSAGERCVNLDSQALPIVKILNPLPAYRLSLMKSADQTCDSDAGEPKEVDAPFEVTVSLHVVSD
jgi:hypothetical protein